MKISRPLIIIGLSIIGFGVLFHLQGQSVVGPESSFMYSNPEWISYGLGIAIVGLVIMSIGIATRASRRKLEE